MAELSEVECVTCSQVFTYSVEEVRDMILLHHDRHVLYVRPAGE